MPAPATTSPASILEAFKWEPQPEAENLIHRLVGRYFDRTPAAAAFAKCMDRDAGVRFIDCIDFITPAPGDLSEGDLSQAGFVSRDGEADVYRNLRGIFPTIVLEGAASIALKVDDIVDFMTATDLSGHTSSMPGDAIRLAHIVDHFDVIERHGDPSAWRETDRRRSEDRAVRRALRQGEIFRCRQRRFASEAEAFTHADDLIEAAIAAVGVDRACELFFAAEREFWQRRNRAAQVQKARQDRLGIGWANHDHHTYRCSRQHFSRLVGLWEKLGFVCRERFYAGKEAGWGAQVMEQPNAGIVTFNDVDLSPDELLIDFAHAPLPERKELGTVGLWCALHGESFLEAGMHHLECTFDFNALKEQLERDHGVNVMKPFTDFPFLKQAFTQGERWPVRPERIAALLEKGQITPEQAEKFSKEGAIGSHLENLERNQGFKGFNQTGVSEIIAATDPRKHLK